MAQSNLAFKIEDVVKSLQEQQILAPSIVTTPDDIIKMHAWFSEMEKSTVNEELTACTLAKNILFRIACAKVRLTEQVMRSSEMSNLPLVSVLPTEKEVPVLGMDGKPVEPAKVESTEAKTTDAPADTSKIIADERPGQLFTTTDMKKTILDRIAAGEKPDDLYHEYHDLLSTSQYLLKEDQIKKGKKAFNWTDKQIKQWFFEFVKPVFEPSVKATVKTDKTKVESTKVEATEKTEPVLSEDKQVKKWPKEDEYQAFAKLYKDLHFEKKTDEAKAELVNFFEGTGISSEVMNEFAGKILMTELEGLNLIDLIKSIEKDQTSEKPEGTFVTEPKAIDPEECAKFAMAFKTTMASDQKKATEDLGEFFEGSKYSDQVVAAWGEAILDAKLETKSPFELLESMNERLSEDGEDTILSLKDIKDLIVEECKPEVLADVKLTVQDIYNDYYTLLKDGKYTSDDKKHPVHNWPEDEYRNMFMKLVPSYKPADTAKTETTEKVADKKENETTDSKADAENQGGKASKNVGPFPSEEKKTDGTMADWVKGEIRREMGEVKDVKAFDILAIGKRLTDESEKRGEKIGLSIIYAEARTISETEFPEIFKAKFTKDAKKDAKNQPVQKNNESAGKGSTTAPKVNGGTDGKSGVVSDIRKDGKKGNDSGVQDNSKGVKAETAIIPEEKVESEEDLLARIAKVKRPDFIPEEDDVRYRKLRTVEELSKELNILFTDKKTNPIKVAGVATYILIGLNIIQDLKGLDPVAVKHFLDTNYDFPKEETAKAESAKTETKVDPPADTKVETAKTETAKVEEKKDKKADEDITENTNRDYSVKEGFNIVEAVTKLITANTRSHFDDAAKYILGNIPSKEEHKKTMAVMFNALQDKEKVTGIFSKKVANNKPPDVYKTLNRLNEDVIKTQEREKKKKK